MAQSTMTDSVREVLQRTSCTGPNAYLPPDLERKLYQQVNDAIERAGGDWDRKAKAHVFASEAKAAIDLLLNGEKLPDKNPLDFYATPPDIADLLVQALQIDWKKGPRILEPSAGDGALVKALACDNLSRHEWHLAVVEIDRARLNRVVNVAQENRQFRLSLASYAGDFLSVSSWPQQQFDYVAMNPPFTAEGDAHAYMAHIEQALKFLKPGGRLAAIVPSGCVHGSSRRHQGFRALLIELGAEFRALPEKAFQRSGTGVSCVMIVLEMSADGSRLVAEQVTRKERESMPTLEAPEEQSARNVEQEVLLLPIDMLKPSKLNPRREFDEAQMQKLRDAIRFEGILSALTVRPLPDDTYEIVAGERRFRAATDLGLEVVPVVVRNVSDRQLVEMALSENMNREDLTPIDEAYAFSSLTSLGASQMEIADRIKKDVSYVSNTLRLLKLPKMFQDLLSSGELTRAHGIALCGLVVAGLGPELGILVGRIQSEHLTSRQVEQEVADIKRRHEEVQQPRMEGLTASAPVAPAAAVQSVLTQTGDVVFPKPEAPAEPAIGEEVEATVVTSAPPTADDNAMEVDVPPSEQATAVAPESATETASMPPASTAQAPPPASGSVAVTPPTQAPAPVASTFPQASAPSGVMVTCLIPKELNDWLWNAGFDSPQQALERLHLLGDAATRQGKTLIQWMDQLIEEN